MNIKDLLIKTKTSLGSLSSYFFRGQVTMSNSRLNTYQTCPLKYKFSYEEGLRGFPSGALHFGSAIHDALEAFHTKFDIKGEQGTLDELLKELDRAWVEGKDAIISSVSGPPVRRWSVALAESGATEEETKRTLDRFKTIYKTPEEEKESKDRAIKMLEEYFRDNQTNPNKIVALEKQLNITRKGLDILAYLDRVEKTPDGKYEVVDYKTGKRVQDAEAIKLGGDKQAIIYTMMMNQKFGKKLENFYYYYLSSRVKVPCNPEERLMDAVFDEMVEVSENIKYKRFEPSQGPLCGWCDYEVICPAWKGRMEPFKGIFRDARERGRMTFSYSKMSAYKNCPYNYRRLYIDKIAPKPRHFFAIGHSCHETFEAFFVKPYQSSLKDLREMFEDNWHSEGYKTEEEEAKYKKDGWEWIKNYFEKYIDGQYVQAYAVELYFQLPIGNDYVVIGYIDRLQKNDDGTFTILDYKTDPQLRTQEAVDDDMQLTFYYWAMRQLGIDVSALSLEFLCFNERVVTHRKPEDIPPFIDLVNEIIGDMSEKERLYNEISDNDPEKAKKANELFPAKINHYCGGCDHLVGCPKEHEIRTQYKEYVMNLEAQEEPVVIEPDAEETAEDKKER